MLFELVLLSLSFLPVLILFAGFVDSFHEFHVVFPHVDLGDYCVRDHKFIGKGLICHASFQKFPQMPQCPEMPQEYIM